MQIIYEKPDFLYESLYIIILFLINIHNIKIIEICSQLIELLFTRQKHRILTIILNNC